MRLLTFRSFLLCVTAGAVIGGSMIFLHRGPGIKSLPGPSNPSTRNQQRVQLLNQLQAALTHYKKEHGNLPIRLATSATQICTSYGAYCKQVHLADLSFLTTQGNYIPTMPMDPLCGKGNWASGFFIQQTGDSVTITAPEAEQGKSIAVNFPL